MNILSEQEFEDILVVHPELIEDGLQLIERQGQLENKRTDLIFADKEDNILLTELKRDVIVTDNVYQIQDYIDRLKSKVNKRIRAMLIGQKVPSDIQKICLTNNIEWKEINTEMVFNYLKEQDPKLYRSIFVKGKLHQEAATISKMSFQDYLNETSPFGVPYTSYQFFAPKDASPELSNDNKDNQIVADEFIRIIKDHSFDRHFFNNNIHLKRSDDKTSEWSVKAKGAWQGDVISYSLKASNEQYSIPCEVYLGTIGYRGNKTTFADEKSRFMVARVGKGKKQITTQYGFHKYLSTNNKSLLPYYELKFNAKGLPKKYWNEVYSILDKYGYFIRESDDKKPTKILWLGNISLSEDSNKQVGNLIEALFAVTILKSHYKEEEKGYEFEFLKG
ncbi:endonuclease NucS domain-containing protein [Virgibacillus sp. DJP39]|uniref:endonuclease NucS domain-containing protein n=1 Tax=Virgibacillus sp. DJP39 TaxID=3409790 RepID=UPI003BB7CE4E